jgi:RNA polymerase sigma-70 factor (ECF subfamily)
LAVEPALHREKGGLPAGTLERLVAENLGWLQGWLRGRVNDRELIHDVSQESFLKAFRSVRDLKDLARFPAWLYRIAENTLRDHLRSKVRRRRVVASDDLDALESRVETIDPERTEEAERLMAAIRSLPARYREPFLLRHSRELSYTRIAEILGLSENAVQVRVFRARRMLAKKLTARPAEI